nr:immunoglobulin light chain junction region [Macaca mulatta]MOW31248.1 immunoglobulin light chain junction region [Macaca mulatta]MOW31311.1 immunoglobulin light chain junction region [Macaca mulatta]
DYYCSSTHSSNSHVLF